MKRDLRNPLQRARGLGSAQSGAQHWWNQRLTAVAMIVLVTWFVATVLSMLHTDYAMARATIAKPWNAVAFIGVFIAMYWHAVLGLQVVIEDYVHTRWLEVASLVVIKLLASLAVLAGVLAVLRIALGS
jgi:succinate dehydrogenase / fumarate reductase membrane anchor subunit